MTHYIMADFAQGDAIIMYFKNIVRTHTHLRSGKRFDERVSELGLGVSVELVQRPLLQVRNLRRYRHPDKIEFPACSCERQDQFAEVRFRVLQCPGPVIDSHIDDYMLEIPALPQAG